MKIKVIVHEAEECGYWAEVFAIPGCATQGETFEELLKNLYEAVKGGSPSSFLSRHYNHFKYQRIINL